jgi:hypothetical protein
MPRIPYNPSETPYQAQRQPRVNPFGIRRGIAINASADADLANASQNVVNLGMQLRQDKVEEDNFADMQRFEAVATDAEIKMNGEVDKIQVADGVDYMEEAQSSSEGYLSTLREWVATPGNVRHNQKQAEYNQQIAAMELKLKGQVASGNMEFEQKRNIGAGKKGIENGIRLNQPESIERGVMSLHLAKARGYESADEAQIMYERHAQSAKQSADKRTLENADALLINGDTEGFKEAVDSTELLTLNEKSALKKQKISSNEYSKLKLLAQEAEEEGLGALDTVQKQTEGFKHWDNSKGHQASIKQQINAVRKRIERGQGRNMSLHMKLAAKGEFDAALFDEQAAKDNAEGLGVETVDQFRKTLIASVEAWNKEEDTKKIIDQVKTQKDYKEIDDKITAGLLSPGRFHVGKMLSDIEDENFHPSVAAELVGDVFRAADAKYQESDEVGTSIFTFMGGREVTDGEKRMLQNYTKTWGQYVDLAGVPDDLRKDFEVGIDVIREAFEDGDNVDAENVKSKVMRPILKSIIEYEKYGTRYDR